MPNTSDTTFRTRLSDLARDLATMAIISDNAGCDDGSEAARLERAGQLVYEALGALHPEIDLDTITIWDGLL